MKYVIRLKKSQKAIFKYKVRNSFDYIGTKIKLYHPLEINEHTDRKVYMDFMGCKVGGKNNAKY